MKRLAVIATFVACLIASPAAQATQPVQPKPKPQPCPCCVDLDQRIDQLELVWNQRLTTEITNLRNEVTVLRQKFEQLENWVTAINVNVNTVINRIETLSCQSDRVYDFRVRTQIDGSPVTEITRVQVMGQDVTANLQDKDRGGWHRNGGGRLAVRASYAGVTAPAGQVRTVVVFARTEDGRTHRLAQKLRLCLEDDGNMNDRSAQGRAED